MAHPPKLLVFLLVGLAAGTGFSLKLYKAESLYGCIDAALSDINKGLGGENSPLEKRSFVFQAGGEDVSSEDEKDDDDIGSLEEKEKRTFPATVTRYKSMAQVPGKSKGSVATGQTQSDRRTKFTLSLDVPTNLMNILFNIAKAKNLRAKAAANAQLMAQIGRRK
nr:urocortin-3 isoform X2 [Pogona vitticeps]